jgi:hypothetical protein
MSSVLSSAVRALTAHDGVYSVYSQSSQYARIRVGTQYIHVCHARYQPIAIEM